MKTKEAWIIPVFVCGFGFLWCVRRFFSCCGSVKASNDPQVPKLYLFRSLAAGPVGGILPHSGNCRGQCKHYDAEVTVRVIGTDFNTRWRPYRPLFDPIPSDASLGPPSAVYSCDTREAWRARFAVDAPATIPSPIVLTSTVQNHPNNILKPRKRTTLEVTFH